MSADLKLIIKDRTNSDDFAWGKQINIWVNHPEQSNIRYSKSENESGDIVYIFVQDGECPVFPYQGFDITLAIKSESKQPRKGQRILKLLLSGIAILLTNILLLTLYGYIEPYFKTHYNEYLGMLINLYTGFALFLSSAISLKLPQIIDRCWDSVRNKMKAKAK